VAELRHLQPQRLKLPFGGTIFVTMALDDGTARGWLSRDASSTDPPEKPTARCAVCAQPATKLKCVKCRTPYCSVACQTVDWKERGHKKECKRRVKAPLRDEAPTLTPTPEPKAAPPVVDGPARGRADVARAKAAAAAATARIAPTPGPQHWLGTPWCPVCLEDWDVNADATIQLCCCKHVCSPCDKKLVSTSSPCPLCRTPYPKSSDEAVAMIRRNMENGIPSAIGQLGQAFERGVLGVVKSHKKAAQLNQRAADLGEVVAMYNLGVAYKHGRGVKLDKKKSFKYYRMAADRGQAKAQHQCGHCFNLGIGVAPDDAEALRFYKLAADQGLVIAENSLGFFYARGIGDVRDAAEAARWWERAAAKGHAPSVEALAVLRSASR